MELENGKVYRVKDGPVITDIRVLEQNAYAYLVEVVKTNVNDNKAAGKKAFLEKTSDLMLKITGEVNPDDIDYTPELINLLIEAALIVKDKELFLEMTNKKKELERV